MNENKSQIEFCDQLVVRSSLFPISDLFSKEFSIELAMENISFRNGLLVANPNVYFEAKKYLENPDSLSQKRVRKLVKTLRNYFKRSHEKTVPFGLFAYLTNAKWGDKSSVEVTDHSFFARLDMEVIFKIYQKLMSNIDIKKSVRYIANNTVYVIGDKYRFNEVFFKADEINYQISELEQNEYLDKIYNECEDFLSLDAIVDILDDGEYDRSDYEEFAFSLIENQILVPEIQPTLVGKDTFSRMIEILEKTSNSSFKDTIVYLNDIRSKLMSLKNDEEFEVNFLAICTALTNFGLEIDKKLTIQFDSFAQSKNATLNKDLQGEIEKAIQLTCSFKQNKKLPKLEKFKEDFYRRYENALIPLLEVLDTESGISFGEFKFDTDNVFTKTLNFKYGGTPPNNADYLGKGKILLYKKYIEAIKTNAFTIHFDDEDIEKLDKNFKELATSFQIVLNHIDDSDLIYIYTIGNSSAINLMTRFGHLMPEIKEILDDVSAFESASYEGSIIAEITHIPEYRIGNITTRPTFRDYEIPIVINSSMDRDHIIHLKDLLVTVRNDRIILYSLKHQAEIVPKLTNAHNYGMNTLPVYQFLSELAYQNVLPHIQLHTGVLDHLNTFVPRVQFNKIILSYAQWMFKIDQLDDIFKGEVDLDLVEEFRKKWKIPLVTRFLSNNKNYLIYWDRKESIEELKDLTKNRDWVLLFEFPFDMSNTFIKNKANGHYVNEVFAFVKNKSRENNLYFRIPPETKTMGRVHMPGGDWIYLKIYMGYKSYNKFMTELYPRISAIVKDIFFLPFSDPEFHLRIRIKQGEKKIDPSKLLAFIHKDKELYQIQKIVVDTYKQEIERYGLESIAFAEGLFCLDSKFIAHNYNQLFLVDKMRLPLKVMATVNRLLDGFEMNLDQKTYLINDLRNSYLEEFEIKPKDDIDKQLESLMRANIGESREFILKIDQYLGDQTNYTIDEYVNDIQALKKEKGDLFVHKGSKLNFVRSIVHMHCIRMFVSDTRQNEVFIYTGLYKYYVGEKFRQQNKKTMEI